MGIPPSPGWGRSRGGGGGGGGHAPVHAHVFGGMGVGCPKPAGRRCAGAGARRWGGGVMIFRGSVAFRAELVVFSERIHHLAIVSLRSDGKWDPAPLSRVQLALPY